MHNATASNLVEAAAPATEHAAKLQAENPTASPETERDATALRLAVAEALKQAGTAVLGKNRELKMAMACLLAGGHLLIDDRPGLGKTTLARTIAHCTGLDFKRVQFTSDLTPTDILGVSVMERQPDGHTFFRFNEGPVFTQLLLADEINRASPRVQSALLEAMAENQVSIDGETRPLPHPFFVIATQNPVDMSGTFSLPDSQLDRFLLRIHMGYPDAASEKALLRGNADGRLGEQILDQASVMEARKAVTKIYTSEAIIEYAFRLIQATREHGEVEVGLSPRAGIALLNCARAWAFIHGRGHVLPEDVKELLLPVAGHRIALKNGNRHAEQRIHEVIQQILDNTRVH